MALRVSEEKIAEIDRWADEQPDKPNRSEAARRLWDFALKHSKKSKD